MKCHSNGANNNNESRMLFFLFFETVNLICSSFYSGRTELSIEEKTLNTFLHQFSSNLVR